MEVIPFIVESVPEAVAQIRARLGPDAVVVSVRRLEAGGLARLWQKPRLEVLACRQAAAAEEASSAARELDTVQTQLQPLPIEAAAPATRDPGQAFSLPPSPLPQAEGAPDPGGVRYPGGTTAEAMARLSRGGWRIEEILGRAGFLQPQAKQVADALRAEHGDVAPRTIAEELALARRTLNKLWRKPPGFLEQRSRPHVLVGPPGVGKTTCLCKWLTQEVLVEGGNPIVWRLDGATANHAEFLNVHAEILGVRVERVWRGPAAVVGETSFIDLPGVDWRSPAALASLQEQLRQYPAAQVHLVLNAAYELPVLLAQWRALEPLGVNDLIFTHLEEEPRVGKLWNFVLGTNCALRFLSTGQNIPGDFQEATAEKLLARLFP